MKHHLVDLLACPACRGDIEIYDTDQEEGDRIMNGTLQCSQCEARYPVEKGIPRLVIAEHDVANTGRRFNFQWVSHWTGKFEDSEYCYGFDNEVYVDWMKEKLGAQRPIGAGERILDAGCGSGEKTSVMARMCPDQHVVGMDLGIGSLELAASRFLNQDNLDYVQGNILSPPFKSASFHWGVSIGMLHHTPNTRQAFAEFRRLLVEDTATLIWIYPTYLEGREWRVPYFVRDVMFLRQSHRLPPGVLRLCSYGLVCGFLPLAEFLWWFHGQRMNDGMPFFKTQGMNFRQRFSAQVFHVFDTLLPQYQFRHRIREVESWFVEEGLEPSSHTHGYYVAKSPKEDPAAKEAILQNR